MDVTPYYLVFHNWRKLPFQKRKVEIMGTIFELQKEYVQLLTMLEEGEIDEQVLLDTIEGIEGEIEEKANNYARVRLSLLGDINTLKTEEKRLNEKRKALESNVDKLEKTLFNTMKLTNKEVIKTPYFTFRIAKNPKSLVIDRADLIPSEYLIEQAPAVDTKALKEALKNGMEFDFAHLEQGESLRIK